jgi:hypothetical protein
LAEVRKMKEREAEDKRHIDQLLQTRKEAATAKKISLKLSEYSEKLRASLPDCLTKEAKREFLEIYGVKVAAARGKYKFVCFADVALTSDDYNEEFEAAFTKGLKNLEKQHPEITLLDLMDWGTVLPNDHPLAELINKAKQRVKSAMPAGGKPTTHHRRTKRSYVTIERTSA